MLILINGECLFNFLLSISFFNLDFKSEVKERKRRLLALSQEFEEGNFLCSSSQQKSTCGDGGQGCSSGSAEDEAAGGGEAGGGHGLGEEEDWLSHGHGDQADGEGDSE